MQKQSRSQSRSLRQPGFHGSGWLRHCEAKQGSARRDVPCINGDGSPWQVSPASRGLQVPRWTRPLLSRHTIDSLAVARIPPLSSAAPWGSSVVVCPPRSCQHHLKRATAWTQRRCPSSEYVLPTRFIDSQSGHRGSSFDSHLLILLIGALFPDCVGLVSREDRPATWLEHQSLDFLMRRPVSHEALYISLMSSARSEPLSHI